MLTDMMDYYLSKKSIHEPHSYEMLIFRDANFPDTVFPSHKDPGAPGLVPWVVHHG